MAYTLFAHTAMLHPTLLRRGQHAQRKHHATLRKREAWRWLLALLLFSATVAVAQQKSNTKNSDAKWETLAGCRLITNPIADGDSFHVLYQDREYISRLYFGDTPEGDATLTERAGDQAAYFGISPDDIPRAATLASQINRSESNQI